MHIIFFIFLPEGSQRIYLVLPFLLTLSCSKELCLALCSDCNGMWSDAFCHLQVGDFDNHFTFVSLRLLMFPCPSLAPYSHPLYELINFDWVSVTCNSETWVTLRVPYGLNCSWFFWPKGPPLSACTASNPSTIVSLIPGYGNCLSSCLSLPKDCSY